MNKPTAEKQDYTNLLLPFKMYERNMPDDLKTLLPHWHKEMELNFVLNGSATFFLNSKPVVVTAGQILIVNCNEVHSADYHDDDLQSLTFVFDLSMFLSLYRDEADTKYIKPLIDNRYKIDNTIPAQLVQTTGLDRLLTNIAYLYTNKSLTYELKIKCKFLELLSLLYDYQIINRNEAESNADKHIDNIKTILTYIDNNYYKKLTLSDLSNMINYNKDYFTRIFKKYTGVSCFDYITNVRINEAKNLLQTTNLSISTISEKVGYDSQSYFILRFKQLNNISPLTFRNNSQQ